MIIGLDFGSHHSSIALWNNETNLVNVFSDDMGYRHIPCVIAFRKDEILVGHSAHLQRHKNSSNTFDNLRQLLENNENDENEIYIPALDKSITNIELVSHFFRHIFNQVKEQVGKPIKDCIISLPTSASDHLKIKIIESARNGGLRIKSFIHDSISSVLAHRLDDPNTNKSIVIVVDFGWSKSEITCLEIVDGGIFSILSSTISTNITGSTIINLVTQHCVKDFQRKSKISCADNSRSMMRLRVECESAVKILSTSAEASIDLDSLYEGIDYSGKLSRVRFEDLCATTFLSLRELIQSTITQAITVYQEKNLGQLTIDSFTNIVLAGGFSSIPRVQTILSNLLPNAKFLRNRIDPSETLCIGSCWHGANLQYEEEILGNNNNNNRNNNRNNNNSNSNDNSHHNSELSPIPCCAYNLLFSTSDSSEKVVVIESNTPLPISKIIPLKVTPQDTSSSSSSSSSTTTTNFILIISISNLQNDLTLGKLVFSLPSQDKDFEAFISISLLGKIEIVVRQDNQQLSSLSWLCEEVI